MISRSCYCTTAWNTMTLLSNFITLCVFDVDGVFNNGQFGYSDQGKIFKLFGAHDHDAIKLLISNDVVVKSITADSKGYKINSRRMSDMNIPLELVPEVKRQDWFKSIGSLEKTFYMGDGIFDSQCMELVGYSCAPLNACKQAKESASYVTNKTGGDGAVLEAVCYLFDMFKIPILK